MNGEAPHANGGSANELDRSGSSSGSVEAGGGNVIPIPPVMDFDMVDEADAAETLGKMAGIKVAWDPQDLEYWFGELEQQMELIQVKSQWTKRIILSNNLPREVKAEVKEILKKPKSAAPVNIYKGLKSKLLELFGPNEEDAFEKAAQLVLTGKPSALAKRIAEILCQCDPPLSDCCAAKTVAALWKRQLPQVVRTALAGYSLKDDFENTLKHADSVFASLQRPGAAAVTVTPTYAVAEPPVLEGQDGQGESFEVAAVGRGRGAGRGQRWNRGQNRGWGRGQARGQSRGRGAQAYQGQAYQGQAYQGQAYRGQRHPDGPPENACQKHWRFGRQAYSCESDQCPWKHIVATPPVRH